VTASSASVEVFRYLPAHIGPGFTRMVDVVVSPAGIALHTNDAVYEHTPKTVRINKCIIPPWLNTVLFIEDAAEDMLILVSLPPWKRKRLFSAIRASGVIILFRRRWLLNNVR